MPNHKTKMTIERGKLELQSKGERIKFIFEADGEKLGEMSISAGSVDFKAKNKQKFTRWSISKFVRLLEEHA